MSGRVGVTSMTLVVDARDLAKQYGAVQAVASADLQVEPGEIVGICGASGSGKSTFLRLIAGIEPPSQGSALLGGKPAAERVHSGYVMPVFQDPVSSLDPRWPIWRSVTEPLTAPHRRDVGTSASHRRRVAQDALPRVGLHGLDLEVRPGELSGGQCQRVSILRALLAEPALIIADEPTSALDPSVAAGILQLLRQAAGQGTAMVIVSHQRTALTVLCDRVLEMQQGMLQVQGLA
jgi:peptide/nickel transport system ATP-binding protein